MRFLTQASVIFPALFAFHASAAKPKCSSLATSLKLAGVDAKIASSVHVPAGTNVTLTGGQALYCLSSVLVEVDLCRVTLDVATSNRSSSYIEVWLPDKANAWNGRFLSTGGSGLSGCVDYRAMAYTTSLGFASTGDNSGHDGSPSNGTAFFNNTDIVLDFAWRARHSAVVVGKQIVKQFYGQTHKKSYYYGCSTGGRQGFKAAQMFPEDFDGIIAGAPAVDFNHLNAWSNHFALLTGLNETDPRWLTIPQWTAVHAEVLKQCDSLDGVVDGILEDSSICNFNPETILCARGLDKSSGCLTPIQAQTVRNVFLPLYGVNNTFLYPRLSPSAELGMSYSLMGNDGTAPGPGPQWYQNAIYNNRSWDGLTLNGFDVAYADSIDAKNGNVSSWDGDLSKFRASGGKIISYHGLADTIISGENAMRYYGHVATTMNATNKDLDNFYRLFRISGMDHCVGGDGAWEFGQSSNARNGTHNIISDIVNWVENGTAPDRLIGTKFVNDRKELGIQLERAHCRYPYRTTYKGGNPNITASWDCELIADWNVCGGPSDKLPKLC